MVEKVAVIGAGISGLVAARILEDRGFSVKVYESLNRLGGKIHSEDFEGDIIEWGPQTLSTSHDEFESLIRLADVQQKVKKADSQARNRYVYRYNRIHPLPTGLIQAFASPLVGPYALFHVFTETFKPHCRDHKTVEEFFKYRFGKKILENVIDPFVSGVYSGDCSQLDVRFAFKKVYQLASNYGSIVKGLVKSKSGFKKHQLISFEGGMAALVDGLARQLIHTIEFGQSIKSFSIENQSVRIQFKNNHQETVDRLVITIPTKPLSRLLRDHDVALSSSLNQIPVPPIAIANVLMNQPSHVTRPRGFGVLVTSQEKIGTALGVIMRSDLFPRQDGRELYTIFFGGRRFQEVGLWNISHIKTAAVDTMKKLLNIDASSAMIKVNLYTQAIPQYEGQQEVLTSFVNRFHRTVPQVRLTGNWLGGISVLDAAQNARQAMENWSL